MKTPRYQAIQIAFTYMGTIVGAGFATGQEILQFFTKYGYIATYTIAIATILFVWLGYKLMLLSYYISAKSYEDLNKAILGERLGKWVSHFMLIILLGVSSVMLAGAGTIFHEHWDLSYQLGLILTGAACYLLLQKGMNAILAVNSIVVPFMLLFTLFVILKTSQLPTSAQFISLETGKSFWSALASPFLYVAFNLALAQAVLVPLGSQVADTKAIRRGAILGGIGIGFMLIAGHFALSANMPDIAQYSIPMGGIAKQFGFIIQTAYIFIIFSEIFTTLIADIYGLTLQLHSRIQWSKPLLLFAALVACYFISQIGFQILLSTLYPIFGFISLIWLIQLFRQKTI
ncbi:MULTISPECIES: YkvI family membrane protein [unclassified Paenibacillus]|uniref:YkvI family membrane protein n=1 Tax=unclassified Paenibacillus TaxID=185978 RepID=UPI002F3E93C3